MNQDEIKIQTIDPESIEKNYFCAYHSGLEQVIAVIVFHDDDFSIFWSDSKLPLGIQLEVLFEARAMCTARLS